MSVTSCKTISDLGGLDEVLMKVQEAHFFVLTMVASRAEVRDGSVSIFICFILLKQRGNS